jgi:hypothetical protein
MPQRQLNIRSDEAAERASALAKRLGKTTTEVVVEALRSYEALAEPRDERGLTPDQRRRSEAIMQAAEEFRRHAKPDADWDGLWMYDERGLPK